ncbi:MAG: hypothetical protein ACOX6Z_07485 [Dethiobacteria bacterium]|jgi:hypothetical protein
MRKRTYLPARLKEIAEAQGVNYSKILQVAFMDSLGTSKRYGARL